MNITQVIIILHLLGGPTFWCRDFGSRARQINLGSFKIDQVIEVGNELSASGADVEDGIHLLTLKTMMGTMRAHNRQVRRPRRLREKASAEDYH